MISISQILAVCLLFFPSLLKAQNTAFMGCFSIPNQGLSGVSVQSALTFDPSGCATECRRLPEGGFSPVNYALYSANILIGQEVQAHCLCTNDIPLNADYDGPGGSLGCQNDSDYAAELVDTPVTFKGCFSTLYDEMAVFDSVSATYPGCAELCANYEFIAINHGPADGNIRCRCSPFILYDPASAVVCMAEDNNYLIYQNTPSPQPSGRPSKRDKKQLWTP
ncbi:uncharacterized protein IL334_000034 [Kwoniella shivajii]|uniref:WSC domain-containing protein n=1 Tax=Kwoniella shivajii TaxID=564305 RepID=A0ABZ1CN01_9TREE|nr:hypothetical protein IL334_000034 [Kwoniella shivajii]